MVLIRPERGGEVVEGFLHGIDHPVDVEIMRRVVVDFDVDLPAGRINPLVAAHGGEEVNEAGDGFFFAFAQVASAVEAAVLACVDSTNEELADYARLLAAER